MGLLRVTYKIQMYVINCFALGRFLYFCGPKVGIVDKFYSLQ